MKDDPPYSPVPVAQELLEATQNLILETGRSWAFYNFGWMSLFWGALHDASQNQSGMAFFDPKANPYRVPMPGMMPGMATPNTTILPFPQNPSSSATQTHKTEKDQPMPTNDSLANVLMKADENKSLKELLSLSPASIQGVSEGDAALLQQAFNIKTIEDMGTNKFFLIAQALVELSKHEKL